MKVFKYVYFRFYRCSFLSYGKYSAKWRAAIAYSFVLSFVMMDIIHFAHRIAPGNEQLQYLVEQPFAGWFMAGAFVIIRFLLPLCCNVESYAKRWEIENPEKRVINGVLIVLVVAFVIGLFLYYTV